MLKPEEKTKIMIPAFGRTLIIMIPAFGRTLIIYS